MSLFLPNSSLISSINDPKNPFGCDALPRFWNERVSFSLHFETNTIYRNEQWIVIDKSVRSQRRTRWVVARERRTVSLLNGICSVDRWSWTHLSWTCFRQEKLCIEGLERRFLGKHQDRPSSWGHISKRWSKLSPWLSELDDRWKMNWENEKDLGIGIRRESMYRQYLIIYLHDGVFSNPVL